MNKTFPRKNLNAQLTGLNLTENGWIDGSYEGRTSGLSRKMQFYYNAIGAKSLPRWADVGNNTEGTSKNITELGVDGNPATGETIPTVINELILLGLVLKKEGAGENENISGVEAGYSRMEYLVK